MVTGESAPKYVNGATTVLLDHATIVRDEPETRNVEHRAPIEGSRKFKHRGQHWIFEILINLHLYADPLSSYDNIRAYLGQNVTLYRHRDKQPVKDSSGTVVPFRFMECTPLYQDLIGIDYRQRLRLLFKSTKYVDITKSTVDV